MPYRKAKEDCTESTRFIKDRLDVANLRPAVKMALRMYAYGACKTLTEAAEATGLSVSYLSMAYNSLPGQQLMDTAQEILNNKALEGSQLLDKLGKRAIEIIGGLMEDSDSQHIQLKAAVDLADRSPTYSKIQKHQVESFTLAGRDAQAIAEALVAGKSIHETYAEYAAGNHDKVNLLPEETNV